MCGDKYPIISKLEYSGLIAALTTIDSKEVVRNLGNILNSDPIFFQYILKIIPIDYITETDISSITSIISKKYEKFIPSEESFKIELNRRKSDIIERQSFIDAIARIINRSVNLDAPDVIVRFEILGNTCAISFLKRSDILEIVNTFNPF